ASSQRRSHRGRTPALALAVQRCRPDSKAQFGADVAQRRHVALSMMAKVKVLAHYDASRSQLTDQHPLNEVSRGLTGERGVKSEHANLIHAQRRESFET